MSTPKVGGQAKPTGIGAWELLRVKFQERRLTGARRVVAGCSFSNKLNKKLKLLELQCDFQVRRSALSYQINVDWNSIRLSGFLLWPQYLSAADEGAGFLSLGPVAILHQVKVLAHLYSITLWTFIYFKEGKMRLFFLSFWGNGQPLGPTAMMEGD